MYYRLEWMDRKGCFHVEQSRYVGRFWRKLETLRCPADLWTVDTEGCKLEIVGGCEQAQGHDDRRIKWQWWYDQSI